MAHGGTQNASEMEEATQMQVHRCEKGEGVTRNAKGKEGAGGGEMDGEIARLARWCDGGAGACVVPKNAKAFLRDGIKVACKKRARVACKRG